jgi:hypothetical protein
MTMLVCSIGGYGSDDCCTTLCLRYDLHYRRWTYLSSLNVARCDMRIVVVPTPTPSSPSSPPSSSSSPTTATSLSYTLYCLGGCSMIGDDNSEQLQLIERLVISTETITHMELANNKLPSLSASATGKDNHKNSGERWQILSGCRFPVVSNRWSRSNFGAVLCNDHIVCIHTCAHAFTRSN